MAAPLRDLQRRPPQPHSVPAIDPGGQVGNAGAQRGVEQALVQLRQGYQGKGPLVKPGMGYLEAWAGDLDVAVKENVHVDEARAVAQASPL